MLLIILRSNIAYFSIPFTVIFHKYTDLQEAAQTLVYPYPRREDRTEQPIGRWRDRRCSSPLFERSGTWYGRMASWGNMNLQNLRRIKNCLLSRSSVGISVARAREARVSMIRFTHSICTACNFQIRQQAICKNRIHQQKNWDNC